MKKNIISDTTDKLYKGLDTIVKYFIKNSLYSEDKYRKYIYPFLLNNGYFYFKLEEYFSKDSFRIKTFFDLSLNNYELLYDIEKNQKLKEFIGNNSDYLFYYLSFILRIGITDFIIYKNNITLEKYLFKEYKGFYRLKNLTNCLRFDFIEYKDIHKNIKKFIEYLLSEKKEINIEEKIIELLDIGSSLSLFLITIYFNHNYSVIINLDNESLLELFKNLIRLCNIISSQEYLEEISYNKKLILFSLFSIFNISPIPYNENILDKKNFKIYNYISVCLLNYNSILNSINFFNAEVSYNAKYFDIFSQKNNDIFTENYVKLFNIEGNNIIINYNIITILFRLILSGLIQVSSDNFFKQLKQPKIFINNNDNYKIHNETSILFYYHCLNYYIKNNNNKNGKFIKRINSLEFFFDIINRNFSKSSYLFPIMKNKDNLAKFYLNDYFRDLMLFDKINYDLLYSFLINYNRKNNNANAYLLIFLLKEKWNIDFKCKNDYSFKNDIIYNCDKLIICFNHIKKGKTNIFISLILLRRIFPLILFIIQYYLENKDEDNIINKNYIKILTYKQENIWDGNKSCNILEELKNSPEKENNIENIIKKYFLALIKTMKRFSEFGYCYNNQTFLWPKKSNLIKIINYKGKGIYKKDKKEKYVKKRISIRYSGNIVTRIQKIRFKINLIKKSYLKRIKKELEEIKQELNKKENDEINDEKKEEEEEEEEEIEENKEEEEEEEEKEEKIPEEIYKNIVIHYNKQFYGNAIDIATGKKKIYYLKDIIGSFEREYKKNYKILEEIDNEYYYLFELTFYCIYLNLLELYFKIKNIYTEKSSLILDYISKFIKVYESYSLYINFIDKEGSKTFIKNKYDELFYLLPSYIKLYPRDYKSILELRKYFLNNKKFKFYKNDYIIDIIEKDINFIKKEKYNEIYPVPTENDIKTLNISLNNNYHFYKGEKAEKAKIFYEKFDFDKKDNNQRNKYFNNLIDSYLNILD